MQVQLRSFCRRKTKTLRRYSHSLVKDLDTDFSEPILVRLAYPSSIFGNALVLPPFPDNDLIVDAELARRSIPGRSSIMLFPLVKLPYKLDPEATDRTEFPQSRPSCTLPHCEARSCPFLPASATSTRCRGGGSGGGGGSLAFGIGIAIDDVDENEVDDLYDEP